MLVLLIFLNWSPNVPRHEYLIMHLYMKATTVMLEFNLAHENIICSKKSIKM